MTPNKPPIEEDEDADGYWCIVPASNPVPGVYDNRDIELQLEDCMNDGFIYIVVDDFAIASRAVLAISTGNFLHKAAVIFSLSGILFGGIYQNRIIRGVALSNVALGICFAGVSFALLYEFSWARDPYCQYQLVHPKRYLTEVPMLEKLNAEKLPKQVILRRRNDSMRRVLHRGLASCALLYCSYKLYKFFK